MCHMLTELISSQEPRIAVFLTTSTTPGVESLQNREGFWAIVQYTILVIYHSIVIKTSKLWSSGIHAAKSLTSAFCSSPQAQDLSRSSYIVSEQKPRQKAVPMQTASFVGPSLATGTKIFYIQRQKNSMCRAPQVFNFRTKNRTADICSLSTQTILHPRYRDPLGSVLSAPGGLRVSLQKRPGQPCISSCNLQRPEQLPILFYGFFIIILV